MTIIIKRVETEHEWQQMKLLLAELLTFEKSIRPERKETSVNTNGAFRYVRDNIAKHDGISCIACTESGEAVGFINAWIDGGDGLDTDNRVGMISDCYIRPNYRGRCVPQKMLHAMTTHFQSKGVKRLSAETLGTNMRMQKLFAHAGFTVHKMIFEKTI